MRKAFFAAILILSVTTGFSQAKTEKPKPTKDSTVVADSIDILSAQDIQYLLMDKIGAMMQDGRFVPGAINRTISKNDLFNGDERDAIMEILATELVKPMLDLIARKKQEFKNKGKKP